MGIAMVYIPDIVRWLHVLLLNLQAHVRSRLNGLGTQLISTAQCLAEAAVVGTYSMIVNNNILYIYK